VLLFCGASGDLGGRVARRLAGHGTPLRVLVRPSTDRSALHGLDAEVVAGDLRDPPTLQAAVRGVSTVVTSVTAMGRALSGVPLDVRAVDGHGTLALVDAAQSAGVQRFVFVSYAGLDDEHARRYPLAAAKRAVERRLAASPMREVIVRPDAFQEVWLGPQTQFDWRRGRVIVFGRGQARARYVAIDDAAAAVAAFAVADDPPRSVEFGGPQRVTRHEAVAIFERVTGRRIRTPHVPRAALRVGMRVLRRPRPELASVMGLSYFADLDDCTWTDAPLRAIGLRPRSVTAYAHLVSGDDQIA